MITRLDINGDAMPRIIKRMDGRDVSSLGAFPAGGVLSFTVEAPRILGACAVVIRICADGGEDRDIPLTFLETREGTDIYVTSLEPRKLCLPDASGLFYYEFLFLRGADTLFTDSVNNVDFVLSPTSAGRFRLLIYEKEFEQTFPKWFSGGIMYHIFVDRFARGEGKTESRADAVIDPDWYGGIPQYPEKNGDHISNNVFFGGNLWGVAEKLPYLASLGVTVIYLSPIFKAYSNHKYDTGNYLETDGMFGGEPALENLIVRARELGIRIILDGVFNHTGDDSLYFDKYGHYGGVGAYSNPDSVFRDWYRFKNYPDEYESWWGIEILPKLNHSCTSCREFFVGEGGVAQKYINMGVSGWRLDVADELSDDFLEGFRDAVKRASDGEAIIIGEVWENAADKTAYGQRRRYLRGRQLDSVMNYPFRNAVIAFIRYGDAEMLADTLVEIYSSYPRCVCDSLMNLLGTHDTERIITVLGQTEEQEALDAERPNSELAVRRMSTQEYARAASLLKIAATIQYTVYGIPSVFYGDEAGLEGYHDPFCRRPYPWGHEDDDLRDHYIRLGAIRRTNPAFDGGDFRITEVRSGYIEYERKKDGNRIIVAANVSGADIVRPASGYDLLGECMFDGTVKNGTARIILHDASQR